MFDNWVPHHQIVTVLLLCRALNVRKVEIFVDEYGVSLKLPFIIEIKDHEIVIKFPKD